MNEIINISSQEVRKTRIMYNVHLTYLQIAPYLEELQEMGLVEKLAIDGRTLYKATAKGRECVKLYENLRQMLDTNIPLATYKRYLVGEIPAKTRFSTDSVKP